MKKEYLTWIRIADILMKIKTESINRLITLGFSVEDAENAWNFATKER